LTLTLGIALALATSVCWLFGNVLVQKSSRALGTPRATLWALVVGAAASAVAALAAGEPRTLDGGGALAGWAALAGGTGLLAYAALFYALEHAPLSLAVPVVSSWSLVAALLSLTVLGERLGGLPLVGAGVVFAGVLLVAFGTRGSERRASHRLALVAPFAAALGFGLMIPALTRVAAWLGPLAATSLVYLLIVALGLPLALAFRIDVRPPPRQAWPLVLGTAAAETLGFVCVAAARRFAPLTVVTPVSSLAATLTVLYAWLVLGERPPRVAAVGAALACAGVVVLSL
jgi:drug/metabolite transporter (DMT)-like permease